MNTVVNELSARVDTAPEVGKTYHVNHSRKGAFDLRVTHVDDEWTSGVVVNETVAKAALAYNFVYDGEEITIRTSFCRFVEVCHGKS